MRCPHCAGQIPDASRFCGICGRQCAGEAAAAPPGQGAGGSLGSMSLFELPVSRGARYARIATVLLLDAILAGFGIAMIIWYLNERDDARARPPAQPDTGAKAEVEVLPPSQVGARPKDAATASPPKRAASRGAKRSTRAVVRTGSERRPPDPGSTGVEPEPKASTPPPSGAQADAGAGASDEEVAILTRKVRLAVSQRRSHLQRCYAQAAKVSTPDKPLEGKVIIRFEIVPSGKAEKVRPTSNTSGSNQLAQCVAALVRSWRFPGASAPVEFVWPFVFKAPKEQ